MALPRPPEFTRAQWRDRLYNAHPTEFDDELVVWRQHLAARGYPTAGDDVARAAAADQALDDTRADRFREVRGDGPLTLRDLILIVLMRNDPSWQGLIARRAVE